MPLIGKQVLVVDDEAGFREVLLEQFQLYGAAVTTSDCGRHAFEIVKAKKIDAIVSDIRMPNGDGLYLLDQIEKSAFELPVFIFITGFAEFDEKDLKDRGVVAVFSKPFEFEQLMKVLSAELLLRTERTETGVLEK